jgi:hypothetical protein
MQVYTAAIKCPGTWLKNRKGASLTTESRDWLSGSRNEIKVAGSKVSMALPDGRTVEGITVAVEESTERWSDFQLEDGTKVRAKVTITEAHRATNDYDPQGLPWYRINVQPIMVISEVPESLKKKEQ